MTRTTESLLVKRTAVFSECEDYRYVLKIQWDLPRFVNFLMLNPSTADENKDDPTVAKCRKWAIDWGFGGVVITNLFALRATDPKVMLRHESPEGPENDMHIVRQAMDSQLIVCAWGKDGNHRGRADFVCRLLPKEWQYKLMALKVTKQEPWHPLYLRNDTKPFSYERNAA